MKQTLTLLLLWPYLAFSQNFHFSAKLGVAGYQGDLKAKAVSLSQSSFMGSLGVRYDLNEHVALRTNIMLTSIKGDDARGNKYMKTRNLNFKSSILDWEGGVHYSILDLNYHWWTPYVFAGLGVFHFNPYTHDLNGKKTNLRPLSTEGEGFIAGVKTYSTTQLSIPLAIGVERMINEDMRVGVELGYRKTFTDYLDDVSTQYVDQTALATARGPIAAELAYRGDEANQGGYPPAGTTRGGSKYKDGYFYVGITYTLRFYFDKYKQIAGLPSSRKGKKVGCPATRF